MVSLEQTIIRLKENGTLFDMNTSGEDNVADDDSQEEVEYAAGAEVSSQEQEEQSGAQAEKIREAFKYLYSQNLPSLIEGLGVSLLVTTYQAGKLLVFRVRDGQITMLVRTFDRAMGLAVDASRMAIGTGFQTWLLRNSPDVAAKMKPQGTYDACYIPRSSHVTGGIDVHEMAWAGNELIVVNTMFSCLCTLDPEFSFVPRWKPPFVSALARQDRCHMNGVAVVDGRAEFVTAFGQTDEREGWRPGKLDGGCVVHVPSGEIVTTGLSMPHSPRFHNGRLWVLDSGRGELVTIDPNDGSRETVAKMEGYTRGLAFAGRYAFVGTSKIREKKTFGGVPIEQELEERKCGVSVVDTERGEIVASLEFQGNIAELFDVQLLFTSRFPAVLGFSKPTIRRACVISPEVPFSR